MTIKEEAMEVLINKTKAIFPTIDASGLGEDTNFEEDLHCKSIHIVQYSAALEDEFDLEVPYMEFKKKKTFGEAADFIAEELGE
jgi:acyl carrier protein